LENNPEDSATFHLEKEEEMGSRKSASWLPTGWRKARRWFAGLTIVVALHRCLVANT